MLGDRPQLPQNEYFMTIKLLTLSSGAQRTRKPLCT